MTTILREEWQHDAESYRRGQVGNLAAIIICAIARSRDRVRYVPINGGSFHRVAF